MLALLILWLCSLGALFVGWETMTKTAHFVECVVKGKEETSKDSHAWFGIQAFLSRLQVSDQKHVVLGTQKEHVAERTCSRTPSYHVDS